MCGITCGALDAKSYRSPQLLMVSGIGPAATLQGLGIPVISDLPGVGQNMWVCYALIPYPRMSTPLFYRLTKPFRITRLYPQRTQSMS